MQYYLLWEPHGVKIRRGLIFLASLGPIHQTDSDSTYATATENRVCLTGWVGGTGLPGFLLFHPCYGLSTGRSQIQVMQLQLAQLTTWNCLLGSSKEFGQRLPSNIGLLLRKLWVVVCFHSRSLMICKHGLFTSNRWAKWPWNMPYTRMFTNSKASAMEADTNSQLT